MAIQTVKLIIDAEAKGGTGKNGKPWSMAHVELDNGKTINIFNPIAIGDKVESYKNGEYWNWRKVKDEAQTSSDSAVDATKLDHILKAVNDNRVMLEAIYESVLGETPSPKAPQTSSDKVVEHTSEITPLEAYVNAPEQIDLSEIPF